jgi:sugar lactone lactonase YvrE
MMAEPAREPVELVSEVQVEGLAYPECPRWHNGLLYFSDQYAGLVQTLDERRNVSTVVEVPGRPSGLGWMPNDEMLVVSMLEKRVYRLGQSGLTVHANLESHSPGPTNDMLVDDVGRAYVGNIGFDFYGGEEPRTTALVRVDPDGSVNVVADEVLVPNGMALIDGDRGVELVLAESFAHRLTAFVVGDDGSLGSRRTLADVGDHIPDGICADAAGGVWFASIDTQSCLRVDRMGRITHRVRTGDRDVFACAIGGDTLFLCTSRSHQPDEALALRSGAVETVSLAPLALT